MGPDTEPRLARNSPEGLAKRDTRQPSSRLACESTLVGIPSARRLDDAVTVRRAVAVDAKLPPTSMFRAIMWVGLARAPLPDANYWPGRPLFALVDAIVWPAAWIVVTTHLPQSVGIVGPLVIALAAISALRRASRAVLRNHRYHFTTARWGSGVVGLLAIGLVLKVTATSML
jgi:hypothetical protein